MQRPDIAVRSKEKRVRDFKEVSLGLPKKIAIAEAKRCPQCSDPKCVKGCPLGIDIPVMIRFIREGKTSEALDEIHEKNPFPGFCGRLCSAPCEKNCLLSIEDVPIRIRALERFVFDYGSKVFSIEPTIVCNEKKIAVVGSGLTGLSAAMELGRKGYHVTVFESLEKPGGVLRWGIPSIRMPDEAIDIELKQAKKLNVDIETSSFVGWTVSLDELLHKGYKSVLLTLGAYGQAWRHDPAFSLGGVYASEEFLMQAACYEEDEKINPLNFGKKVVVVGSNYTALDVARFGLRIGKDVSIVFGKPEDDFQATKEELAHAKEEGVKLEALTEYLDVVAGEANFVKAVQCRRLDYADPDSKGEWQLVAVDDSKFTLDADVVVFCSELKPNTALASIDPRLKMNEQGALWHNDDGMTSIDGVFVAVKPDGQKEEMVYSILTGKEAAQNIDKYLQ